MKNLFTDGERYEAINHIKEIDLEIDGLINERRKLTEQLLAVMKARRALEDQKNTMIYTYGITITANGFDSYSYKLEEQSD